MQEILPGLWHWSREHPDLGMRVSSYAVPGAGLALDPLLPEGGTDALARLGVDTVVLTCRHHRRDAPEIQRALGARVLVPEPGLHAFRGRTPTRSPAATERRGEAWSEAVSDELRVEGYGDGDRIASGVHAHRLGAISPDDFALHLDVDHGVLAFADGVVDMDGIGFVPDDLMDDPETVKTQTYARVRELLELPFDALLFAHGTPVPAGGKAALRRWLDAA